MPPGEPSCVISCPDSSSWAVGTLFFRLSSADISWTNPWRDGSKWPHGDAFPWSVLYQLGPFPALATALVAVLVLLAGLRLAKPARFRRHSLYVISVLVLGPGLIANAILKDHWGRPRPRDVRELGGVFPYEPLLTIDPLSPGKSFPSGHATMGFFFFTLYFLLRKHRPRWAMAALAGTCAAGLMIGWARVVARRAFPERRALGRGHRLAGRRRTGTRDENRCHPARGGRLPTGVLEKTLPRRAPPASRPVHARTGHSVQPRGHFRAIRAVGGQVHPAAQESPWATPP